MSAFCWQGAPSENGASLQKCGRYAKIKKVPLFAGLKTPVHQPGRIFIVGSEQGAADHQRRDALKRCIPMAEA